MNVLMILKELNIGGTEHYILSLAQSLKMKGIRIGIACKRGMLVSFCRKNGIQVHIIPDPVRFPSLAVHALSSIVQKGNYRIVHAHDGVSFRHAATLARLRKVPIVITAHGIYHNKNDLRIAASLARFIIVVSPKLMDSIRHLQIPTQKIKLIPNGIDTDIFHPSAETKKWRRALQLPENVKIIAYVGRFSRDKQRLANQFIMASEQAAKRHKSLTAVLVGPGRYRAHLLKFAEQANRRLGRRTILVRPPMKIPHGLYCAADIVVGTGRVALEAMSSGKPVIAYGIAGYHGIVSPSNIENAIRCHFGDHAASKATTVSLIAQDMNALLSRPTLIHSLGKFGNKLVQNRFSIKHTSQKIFSLYTSI